MIGLIFFHGKPCDFVVNFSQGLADNTVIAKVNDVLWDLDRPLEGDASLQLLKFDDKDGKEKCLCCSYTQDLLQSNLDMSSSLTFI